MKAILFDFGGTIDTNGVHWSEKFWSHYQRRHLRVAKPDFEKAFLKSEEMLLRQDDIATLDFRTLLGRQFRQQFDILGMPGAEALAGSIGEECYAEVAETVARTRTLLQAFRGTYLLAVVSNFYGNLGVVCREFSLADLFGVMVDSAVEGVRKPDPAIFSLALGRLGVAGPEAYVVGDSYERDIVPAKVLGCSTIWLKGKSWTTPKSTGAADYTITTLETMKAIVLP
ncbi:MAG TPA: HAD family hydrolase [Bacteroidota bacterium]|nr:HAD family hydrolase [Bacteroidota bacterium]